jgi:hypothetical protein
MYARRRKPVSGYLAGLSYVRCSFITTAAGSAALAEKRLNARRQFIDGLAAEMGVKEVLKVPFNPRFNNSHAYKPEEWYVQPLRAKAKEKKKKLSRIYAALRAVYPDFPWDPSKFVDAQSKPITKSWDGVESHKLFLEAVAQELGVKQVCIDVEYL